VINIYIAFATEFILGWATAKIARISNGIKAIFAKLPENGKKKFHSAHP
jgi:hypothetical protein